MNVKMNNKQDFGLIKNINVDEVSSWENKLFLTIDIDWAHDDILAECIDLIEQANVSATWFATHSTPLLERLRDNPKFELGIHPNFNFLLQGNTQNGGSAEEVLDNLLKNVSGSKSVRSHGMTQSSRLLNMFIEKGLTHDCNHFIPEQAEIELSPWLLWNNIIKVPYFWEDDLTFLYKENTPIQNLKNRNGLKVFNFHPIHIFLNTECLDRYERTREIHKIPTELVLHRFEGFGTRSKLMTLLDSNSQNL